MTVLIQAIGLLTMLVGLSLICRFGYRKELRRKAEEKAARDAQLALAKAKAAEEWRDLCRQIHALPEDFHHADEESSK